jgi:hypothetical protein
MASACKYHNRTHHRLLKFQTLRIFRQIVTLHRASTRFHISVYVNTSYTPEEGAHSPNWPNRLIISIIILQGVSTH